MRIDCPHCGRQGRLPDGVVLSKAVRCPGCNRVFQPNAVGATLPAPPAALRPTQAPPPWGRHETPARRTATTGYELDTGDELLPSARSPAPPPIPVGTPVIEVRASTRLCEYCGESIQAIARKCKHCGELLDPALRAAEEAKRIALNSAQNQPLIINNVSAVAISGSHPVQRWSPGVAALLSFVLPGAGQIYKGQPLNGLVWFLLTIGGYLTFIVPGAVLHLCCVIGAASGDPYR